MRNRLYFLMIAFLLISFGHAQNKVIRIDVSPSKVTLRPGQTCQFKAIGYNLNGKACPFTPEWEATGGKINQTGFYIAGKREGVHTAMASSGKTGARGSAVIFIRANENKIAQIRLVPSKVILGRGMKYQFRVHAYNSKGQLIRVPNIMWRTKGGMITGTGMYKAGNVAGVYPVLVKVGKFTALAQVHIRKGKVIATAKIEKNQFNSYFKIFTWKSKAENTMIGSFTIKFQVLTPKASLVRLILYKNKGQQVLSQMPIRMKNQICTFRGKYIRKITRTIGLKLYNKNLKPICAYRKKVR